jgi:hypothetical protein
MLTTIIMLSGTQAPPRPVARSCLSVTAQKLFSGLPGFLLLLVGISQQRTAVEICQFCERVYICVLTVYFLHKWLFCVLL